MGRLYPHLRYRQTDVGEPRMRLARNRSAFSSVSLSLGHCPPWGQPSCVYSPLASAEKGWRQACLQGSRKHKHTGCRGGVSAAAPQGCTQEVGSGKKVTDSTLVLYWAGQRSDCIDLELSKPRLSTKNEYNQGPPLPLDAGVPGARQLTAQG